jgi:protein gp37
MTTRIDMRDLPQGIKQALLLPNVWLGVSVENQARADERIPLLLDTPAAVRFVSAEPLLGPLNLHRYVWDEPSGLAGDWERGLDWCIVGGESGGPPERRLVERCETSSGMPYHQFNIEGEPPERAGRIHKPCSGTGWRPKPEALEWVRSIRDQCQAAGVPFFFKQWGGPTPKSGGRLLDGREWGEMPRQEVRA